MHCQAKPCQVGLSHLCHVYDISLSNFFLDVCMISL